jgi:serine/threonine protein kinase
MEERYQIRGKLGQGGLGSVYRAFDTRMNREVAIKRITTGSDKSLEKEATAQLQQEAGALATLQHPNIVTVYDVDRDVDGPYVVMELIGGKTLDELVEHAPLTFTDFKELAKQVQEGLIAAQDLGLVHRDLKPGNLMLNWLPSGKFQVKIVDFGLARLMPKPMVEVMDENDSIFGSIFFMAPEQFERIPIDVRVDMYSIGCVYYHALTGEYPFNGATGQEVMTAHLYHTVTPLTELRPDLPQWICDWIMWHINRMPDDRPDNARRALQNFIQNENAPPPPAPKAKPHVGPPLAKRPGMAPQTANRIHTAPLQGTPAQPKTQSAPKPLTPPEGSKPSVHTSEIFIPENLPARPAPVPTGPVPVKAAPTVRAGPQPHLAGQRTTFVVPPPKPKKKMKKSEKTAIWIAVVLVAAFVAFAIYWFGRH